MKINIGNDAQCIRNDEVQIQNTMKYHHSLRGNKVCQHYVSEDVRKDGFYIANRHISSCYNYCKNNRSFSTKIENVYTQWPRNSLLEIYTHMTQEKYTRMYILALFIISTNSEQPKCSSAIRQINKLCVTTVDYYAV